ncbi:lipopolysaccharide assembly protein LapA domain-containing protein [Pseudomonas poae]|nr:lipopolysaccharide assembly protein LapA domain-containing protein [Pseudomonas poae]
MLKAKRILLTLMVAVVILAILAFVLENQNGVTLSFLGLSTAQLPVSVFVVLALIIGMLIGPLFVLLTRRSHRRKQTVVGQ